MADRPDKILNSRQFSGDLPGNSFSPSEFIKAMYGSSGSWDGSDEWGSALSGSAAPEVRTRYWQAKGHDAGEPPQRETLFDDRPELLGRHMRQERSVGDIADVRATAAGRGSRKAKQAYSRDQKLAARGLPPVQRFPGPMDPPRKNYSFIPGQRVMPEPEFGAATHHDFDDYETMHGGGPWESSPLEINHEGNVSQYRRFKDLAEDAERRTGSPPGSGSAFRDWAPQMSRSNKAMWDAFADKREISTSAVLHTAQSRLRNPDHDHITGPMDPESTTKILMHAGVPWIVDGHHRLMEARGRGLPTFHASVLNTDQIPHEELEKRGYL